MIHIRKQPWGSVDGRKVHLFTMEDAAGMQVKVSSYGCILQSWLLPGEDRPLRDIVLGYDSLKEYRESETFFGAAIGPIADRLEDGCCMIDGRRIRFPRNAGPDCMHSGPTGFHSRVWDWEYLPEGVAFSHSFTPEESPLPGRLEMTIRYLLSGKGRLRIEYEAVCDQNTLLSVTNHSYFSLSGGASHCRDEELTVHAAHYAKTRRESDPICTGEAASVENTPFDLRCGKKIGDILKESTFPEILSAGGLDHYFLIPGSGLREHARLRSRAERLTLVCRSDMPGLLAYSANGLEAEAGKNGSIYGKNAALCLETQPFPNAANFPQHVHQLLLPAQKRYTSCTEYQILAE